MPTGEIIIKTHPFKRVRLGRVLPLLVVLAGSLTLFQNCAPFYALSDSSDQASSGTIFSSSIADFTCQPEAGPSATHARRLSKRQLENTVRSLMRGFSDAEKTAAFSAAFATAFPDDTGSVFTRNDNTLISRHITGYFEMAKGLANYITGDSARMRRFVSHYVSLDSRTCVTLDMAAPSAGCVRVFIENFGLRVFRRPLSDVEVTPLVNEYNRKTVVREKFAGLIFRTFMAPQFIFHLENQGTEVGPDTLALTAYEVASRLSYHFWNDMPDEDLLTAARTGDILNKTRYIAIVDSVIERVNTRATFEQFYEGWLGLKKVPTFDSTNTPLFRHLAGTVVFDSAMRAEMIKELKDLTNYVTWDAGRGSYADLFTTDVSVTSSPSLMRVYGLTQAATLPITAANVVRMPANERAGVLTRGALLLSGTAYENPIRRGIHILEDFLCLPPKAPDIAELPPNSLETPEFDPSLTVRERYANKTAAPACVGCHSTINPVGFALSAYSALGHHRRQEAVFDPQGSFVRNLPISSEVNLQPIVGQPSPSSTPKQFSSMVAGSMHSQKCFSRKYFEFVYGKPSDDVKDGCALATVRQTIGNDGKADLKSIYRSIAFTESFLKRKTKDTLK